MKALFIGLGSIGTRHLQNLTALCEKKGIPLQADALRSGSRPLRPGAAELLHAQYTDWAALGEYDLAFITNPTHLHAEAIQKLAGRAKALFIEKPIFEATGYDLAALGLGEHQKAYVAAPMRWCGTMLALKEELPRLKPYSARVICSSYLPDWRPGVDYRTVYSAHREMGGGVTIDLIHEWDYLVELFGVPSQVYNLKGTFSHLEIDSDDLSVYIARYPGLLAEVHLDYFGRTYRRSIELFCKNGTVTADFGAGTLTLEDGTVRRYEEPVNRRYEREMEYFVDYARNGTGESVNPPRTALEVLALTQGETLGGDTVPKMAVIQDSLTRMEEKNGCKYDYVMDLDITSPLRTAEDLAAAYKMKDERDDLDLVYSVTESRRNPCFNMVKDCGDHIEKGIASDWFTARQQAPVFYDVNASIYVYRRDFLANNATHSIWDAKTYVTQMMDTGVLDIDSEDDFLLMEVIADHLYHHYPAFAAVQEAIRG